MKKINRSDLNLKPKSISNLNSTSEVPMPASPAPTSKLDCITWTSCPTECEQTNCPNFSEHLRTCNETFATKCLCGGNTKNCGDTLGCGTKSGGALCCDTGGTCDNCFPLSQGNNCESKDYIKCDETQEIDCVVNTQDCIITRQENCEWQASKDNENDDIKSVCVCLISEGLDRCNTALGCNSRKITCNCDM